MMVHTIAQSVLHTIVHYGMKYVSTKVLFHFTELASTTGEVSRLGSFRGSRAYIAERLSRGAFIFIPLARS
jgi:hypothetical protein